MAAIKKMILLLSIFSLPSACVHMFATDKEEAPQIKADMPTEELYHAAIKFGGQTVAQVAEVYSYRKEWSQAQKYIALQVNLNLLVYSDFELVNALRLYNENSYQIMDINVELFKRLVRSSREIARRLGWNLAYLRPDPQYTKVIDRFFSDALLQPRLKILYYPEMAKAIEKNNVSSAYTIMRDALMTDGEPEYARAMARLRPKQASKDFLDYLALAAFEELRQINFASVDNTTCEFILNHFLTVRPNLSHPNASHLFFYAVSRNRQIADLADSVILSYLNDEGDLIIRLLIQSPEMVQLAYIESAREKQNTLSQAFLRGLQKMASSPDVLDELESVVF